MKWFPQPSEPSPVGFVALATNPANPAKSYNNFHNILRLFDVYQFFLSPQGKRCAIITYKHGIYELPNDLRLKD